MKRGRPLKKNPEATGSARVYRTDLDRLVDLARWRRTRLGRKDYALADAVRDLFGSAIAKEWDEELARVKAGLTHE